MGNVCWGINCRRLGLAFVALFTFVFASDFLIHGVWLKQAYQDSQALWRMPEEIPKFMSFMIAGQLLASIAGSIIFAKGYEGKGIAEGIRFGLLMGLWGAGYFLVQYAVSPLSGCLVASWVGAGFGQGIIGGVILALIYRK